MKRIKKLIISLSLMFATASGFANKNVIIDTSKTNTTEIRPVQLTLIAPVGTNGLESYRIANKLSLNILAGVNGGLEGAAFSGWADVELGDVYGLQMAGWFNANTRTTTGAQFAGLLNYSQGYLDGVQFSGLSSIALEGGKGAQFSGLVSTSLHEFNGAQFSGLVSLVGESSKAYQFSGLANAVLGATEGFQAAGLANVAGGNDMGQVAGLLNTNIGDQKGVQIAGLLNVNTGKVQGFQASGLANYTKELKGIQLGFFNYTDSLESGAVIGFLSFVRNGFHSLALSSHESLYGNVEFRTGTDKFYNILSLGTTARSDEFYWAYGYGIGTKVEMGSKATLNLETIVYHINEGTDHTNRLNLLNKYQALATFNVASFMKLSVGPSFNIFVNQGKDMADGTRQFSEFAPFNVFDKTYNNETNVKLYPGLTVGLQF